MSTNPQPDQPDSGPERFRQLFTMQVERPEEDLEMDRAALYLAGEEYPSLDVEGHLGSLDALAEEVAAGMTGQSSPAEQSSELGRYLFQAQGFRGNSGDYYSPDNSFLNRVLETKTGIPISLSLLFLEVARRIGLRCRGVGLPGHFLVGLEGHDLYLDPYNAGNLLTGEGCRSLVHELFGDRMAWNDEFLVPYTKYDFLFRMLNNLKVIYEQNGEFPKALGAIQRMRIVSPGLPSLYKDLARCHYQQQEYRAAIQNLENYLQAANEPDDAQQVRSQIQSIWTALNRLN